MQNDRNASGFGLVEVLDRVLDKGIVVDAAVRVSLVGVELLGVDARIVVASIETYLKHADALAYTGMAGFPQPRRPEPPLFAEPAAHDMLEAAVEPTADAALPGSIAEPAAQQAPEQDAPDEAAQDEGRLTDPPPATGL